MLSQYSTQFKMKIGDYYLYKKKYLNRIIYIFFNFLQKFQMYVLKKM